jgi:hypothetical protein
MNSRDTAAAAMKEWAQNCEDMLTEWAKENPDAFRRGAIELLYPRPTAAQQRTERAAFDGAGTGQADLLHQRIQGSSLQETVQALTPGR